ncbi:hypothetical protein APHAL10511_003407 [Amanita phalloides]|nr:hypothetical protein APHAL10511_003407 [Amanita phalloides]
MDHEMGDDTEIISASSSMLNTSGVDLDGVKNNMRNYAFEEGWQARLERVGDDDDIPTWRRLAAQILMLLTEELGKTDLKGSVIPSMSRANAENIIANFNARELKEWKVGVRNGVQENNWDNLIKHPKLKRSGVLNVALGVPIEYQRAVVDAWNLDTTGAIKNRKITPPELFLDINVINRQIHAELMSLQSVVEAFLKNPELPTWVPPENATPSVHTFITGLRIPTYRNRKPSLLFHNLNTCNATEIKKIFGAVTHMCICNTSGSGKTRHIMEALTQYWGFYLVATPDANGVGIPDLRDALDSVAKYWEWVSDLHDVSPEKRAAQSDFFLDLAIQVDGCLQEKHKRIWLLFQLSESLDPQGGPLHPFIQIIQKLRHASDEALDILVNRLNTIINRYFPTSRPILEFDEAQQATRLYPYSGISSTRTEVFRSIIRDIVKVFTKAPIKLVVSGTGLPLADLEESVASGVGKPSQEVEVFHKLGMFDTWRELRLFIQRYVPSSILETPSGHRLQQRMREYFVGRYRFSASFLEYFLMNGMQSPHRLMNKYLERYITCLPGDTGDPFTADEPDLLIDIQMRGFEWDRFKLDSNAIQEAARIVQSHLIKGKSPEYGPVTTKLVEYGIARLCEEHKGHIVEPLAFLSATTSRLRYPVPFKAIFDFHPELTPTWADEMAHIVARLHGSDVSVDVIGGAPQNPGLSVVYYGETNEDVICWIETLDPAPAILIPGTLFGPDVLLRVKLSSSKPNDVSQIVILMGQFKSYMDGNKESLNAQTLSHALSSLHPNHWFKKSLPSQRQKLIRAIKKQKVLRFVAGYPLRPDLKSKAQSVTHAISAFGSSDGLASIKIDALIQDFRLQGEVLNVLAPMETALARKRNLS